MKSNIISIIVAVATFLVLVVGYEISVYLWTISQQNVGPVIRVDIIMVYPIIIGLSVLAFYIHRRVSKKKK